MNKCCNFIKLKKTTPYWWEYSIIFLVSMVMILFYIYWDFKTLTIWSTSILDCIVDGNLYDYYQVVADNVYNVHHSYNGYNYLSLIPWAIWNIPIWLLQRFAGINIVDHTLMLVWSKLFLVFMVAIIIFFTRKIIECFTDDDTLIKWSNYLIITSPFLFMAIALAGQTDVIVIALAVMAVYFLLKGKKGLFFLLMAFSISAKPFFIFAYIAVVLLIEKNIIKIFLEIVVSFAPSMLFNAIYANAPMYKESISAGTSNSIIGKTLENCIPATGRAFIPTQIDGKASIVVIGLVLIYFVAYFINYEEKKEEKGNYIIYMMVAPMLVYMAFANYEFYRKVYLLPFLIIMFAINKKLWVVNVLLEKILGIVGVILALFGAFTAYLDCINRGLMQRFGLLQSVSKCKYNSLVALIAEKTGENFTVFQILCVSVFVAVSLILLVINFPYISKRLPKPKLNCNRAIYWLDSLVLLVIVVSLFLCYFNVL